MRYPLESLVSASGMSEAALARHVGLSGSTLKSARNRGLVESAADRYACRVGLVPWLVWPDWLEDAEVECANDRCRRRFVPKRKGQKYCTTACTQRVASRRSARRRYWSDEEVREAKKESSRTYRAENLRAVKLQQARQREARREESRVKHRAYYAANREMILAKKRAYDARKRAESGAPGSPHAFDGTVPA